MSPQGGNLRILGRVSQVVKNARRKVVGIFWPFAFTSLVERSDQFGAALALGRGYGTSLRSVGRRDVIGYLAQNCQRKRREALVAGLCARLAKSPISCEAFSRCPRRPGTNMLRNMTGVKDRKDPQYVDNAVERYRDCNFVVAVDEGARFGYVSEKIVSAYLAGAVPVFSGARPCGEIAANARNTRRFARRAKALQPKLVRPRDAWAPGGRRRGRLGSQRGAMETGGDARDGAADAARPRLPLGPRPHQRSEDTRCAGPAPEHDWRCSFRSGSRLGAMSK